VCVSVCACVSALWAKLPELNRPMI